MKLFYRRLYFLTLRHTRVNWYFYSIEFGYQFSCNWMWCDTFLYKVVINNHCVTIEGNPILFNCSQGFTQNYWHITAFLNIECKKYKNLEITRVKKRVTERVSPRVMDTIRSETLSVTLVETLLSVKLSTRLSPRLVFFCGKMCDN